MLAKAAIFSFIAFLSFCSCNKSCAPVDIIEIEQEMKDWVAFLPPSYWIYRDSLSGAYDSVSVYDLEYKVVDTQEGKCPTKRQRQLHINFPYDSSHLNYEFIGICDVLENGTVTGEVLFRSKRERALLSPYLLFPIEIGVNKVYGSKSLYTTERILPSLSIQGKTYENVVCTHDWFNLVENAETRFYHVKNIGVVKRVYYKLNSTEPSAVWELVAAEVFQ